MEVHILHCLDLGQAVHELAPVVHDDLNASLLENLGHLFLLNDTTVAAYITDGGNSCSDRAQGATLAVLDGNTLSWFFAGDFACMKVDGRIWFGGWNGETGSSAEDVVLGEELLLAHFLDTGLDSAEGARADDGHPILLALVQFLQDGHDTDTRFGLGLQSLNDFAQFAVDVLIHLGVGNAEAVFLLQAGDEATEVLTNEGDHEIRAGVAIGNVVLLQHLIGEFGTCFEGKFFGENKGVVTVEMELSDLDGIIRITSNRRDTTLGKAESTFGMMMVFSCTIWVVEGWMMLHS